MRLLIGVLALASLTFCLVAEQRQKPPKKRDLGAPKNISIAYLLDNNNFTTEDTKPNSEVQKWLKTVQKKAQQDFRKEFQVKIKFRITDINITDSDLAQKIRYWSSDYLIHAGTYLGYLKQYYFKRAKQDNTENPDIICVLTKYTMYDEDEVDYLAYFKHHTLCATMVPMLLTYVPGKANKTGELLSKLVQKSATSENVTSWEEYLKTCDKAKKEGSKH
uniref:Putative 26 kDa salivary gland protein a n=1 Tax=Ixodes ricinus TaxID=34613 RepID=A0A147BXK7_IXORI